MAGLQPFCEVRGWGSKFLRLLVKGTLFGSSAARRTQRLAQRVIVIVIPLLDFVFVETLITDLHRSGEGPECAQFFDSIADGLSRCRETAVFGVTAFALRQIQFSR
jgi:hypothetical protein